MFFVVTKVINQKTYFWPYSKKSSIKSYIWEAFPNNPFLAAPLPDLNQKQSCFLWSVKKPTKTLTYLWPTSQTSSAKSQIIFIKCTHTFNNENNDIRLLSKLYFSFLCFRLKIVQRKMPKHFKFSKGKTMLMGSFEKERVEKKHTPDGRRDDPLPQTYHPKIIEEIRIFLRRCHAQC